MDDSFMLWIVGLCLAAWLGAEAIEAYRAVNGAPKPPATVTK